MDDTNRPDDAPELLEATGDAGSAGPDEAEVPAGADPGEAAPPGSAEVLGEEEAPRDSEHSPGTASAASVAVGPTGCEGGSAEADELGGDEAQVPDSSEGGLAPEPRAAVDVPADERRSAGPVGRPGGGSRGSAKASSRRVLLADNDPNVAAILELFLRKSGAEVVSVPHGQAALDALAAEGFGLLVCDLDMPVMSGEELLDRIGSDPSTPPVFVISGYVDEVTSARLRSHRAVVDVLRKPFDLRAFAARVGDLLAGRDESASDPGLGLFSEA